MTAHLKVQAGCTVQSGWTGTSVMDLYIIENETQTYDAGLETITQTLGTSNETIGINILGQTRTITVKGKFRGTSLEDAQNFENNLYLIARYQIKSMKIGDDATFFYFNDKSHIKTVATGNGGKGIRCMMTNYTTTQSSDGNVITVEYTLSLQECRSINSL